MEHIFTLLYQVWQIRKLEELALQQLDISSSTLMERAGQAAFYELRKHWPRLKKIVVICGKGNNGGDGYVVARLARKAKFVVKVLQVGSNKNLYGASALAAKRLAQARVKIEPFTSSALIGSQLIVDAILGTGLVNDVNDEVKTVIQAINATSLPVLALDVPSGISADTGNVLGKAVKAQVTVTFLGLKIGLLVGEARDYCGKIVVHDLKLPTSLFTSVLPIGCKLNLHDKLESLPIRMQNCHKGNFGHVLVVGGDYGMGGAARIAAEAALRVGAGLVTVATRIEHVPLVSGTRPEIMACGVKNKEELLPFLDKASVVILGPGLGTNAWGRELFTCVTTVSKLPLIVDADALNILASQTLYRTNWILTPHPKEAARLLKSTVDNIRDDRVKAAQQIITTYGGIVVLKGAGTVVVTANQPTGICDAGNPGMASAGMGDLLSGIIAGLVAQKMDLHGAAKLGVLVHAMAGDNVARQHGILGMLALDLLPEVRKILNG